MLRSFYNILTILIGIQLLGFNESFAQVKVQVVSQKINQTLEWKPGMSLQVSGERAEIYCTTHTLSTIELEVTFISKHENKSVAENDLKKMKWISEKMGNKIFLRNYIELTRNEEKPQSDIKAIYHLKIPKDCALDIKNYFGNINLENINFKFKITSEFSKIDLKKISGKGSINSTFGDITANEIDGNIHIESNRSDIEIKKIKGILEINSTIADILLQDIDEYSEINFDLEKSIVHIALKDFNQYQLQFDLINATLKIPDAMKLLYEENEKEVIKANFSGEEKKSKINFKINTGSLSIED
ncbi:MAG: hypothetical protein KQI35_15455 [Bacteroidetes bacterium]|nr:hypothetical protein [Bacteroidota bacterium]